MPNEVSVVENKEGYSVKSWGFSGHIAVFPSDPKPQSTQTEKAVQDAGAEAPPVIVTPSRD